MISRIKRQKHLAVYLRYKRNTIPFKTLCAINVITDTLHSSLDNLRLKYKELYAVLLRVQKTIEDRTWVRDNSQGILFDDRNEAHDYIISKLHEQKDILLKNMTTIATIIYDEITKDDCEEPQTLPERPNEKNHCAQRKKKSKKKKSKQTDKRKHHESRDPWFEEQKAIELERNVLLDTFDKEIVDKVFSYFSKENKCPKEEWVSNMLQTSYVLLRHLQFYTCCHYDEKTMELGLITYKSTIDSIRKAIPKTICDTKIKTLLQDYVENEVSAFEKIFAEKDVPISEKDRLFYDYDAKTWSQIMHTLFVQCFPWYGYTGCEDATLILGHDLRQLLGILGWAGWVLEKENAGTKPKILLPQKKWKEMSINLICRLCKFDQDSIQITEFTENIIDITEKIFRSAEIVLKTPRIRITIQNFDWCCLYYFLQGYTDDRDYILDVVRAANHCLPGKMRFGCANAGTIARSIPASVFTEMLHDSPNSIGIIDKELNIIGASQLFLTEYPLLLDDTNLYDCLKKTVRNAKYNDPDSHKAVCRGKGSDIQSIIDLKVYFETHNYRKPHKFTILYIHQYTADRMRVPLYERQKTSIKTPEGEMMLRLSSQHSVLDNELYYLLCDSIQDYAIFTLDVEGYVKTWNNGAKRMIQYIDEEIIGKHFSIFFTEEDVVAKKPQKQLRIAAKKGKVEDEYWRVKKDGTKFWASASLTALYKNGQLVGYGKITRDLSERQLATTQMEQAYNEAAQLKADFLSTCSHELRSPLNGVLAGIQLLATTHLSPEQDEIFTIIQQAGTTLSHIIDDILIYSKLGAQKLKLNIGSISIHTIVRNIVEMYQLQSADTEITFTIDESVPQRAKGDAVRFTQVLSNLLDNANKFTDKGSIEVNLNSVDISPTEFLLTVKITDTGIGIESEDINKLFQPFSQVDTSIKKRPGTGLGLSICSDLIKLMGGDIKVSSVVGRGTQIVYTLVLERDFSTPSVRKMSADEFIKSDCAILLAEDNLINAQLLIRLLRKNGFTNIKHVTNGLEALQAFMQEKPSIILMDIRMPVMDGYKATESIRNLDENVPIIALSANANEKDIEQSSKVGMNGHISKPFDIKKILDVIHTYTS